MKPQLTLVLTMFSLGFIGTAYSFGFSSVDDLQVGSFIQSSPDDDIPTLGEVSFVVDLSRGRDSLQDLAIARAELTLVDGRAIEVFGYDEGAGMIIGGAGNVAHISFAGIEENENERQVMALFHNYDNEVIAPKSEDIAIFDWDYNRIGFTFQPMIKPPKMAMPVSIAIDNSGSMGGYMSDVLLATKSFMESLPDDFTRCSVYTFNNQLQHLTPSDPNLLRSCPESIDILPLNITASGNTALFNAIGEGLKNNILPSESAYIPKLIIAVTDGVNTVTPDFTRAELDALKKQHNAKLFVLWLGKHDPEHLKNLADIEIVAKEDLKRTINDFFRTIGISVSGIQTLTLKPQSLASTAH